MGQWLSHSVMPFQVGLQLSTQEVEGGSVHAKILLPLNDATMSSNAEDVRKGKRRPVAAPVLRWNEEGTISLPFPWTIVSDVVPRVCHAATAEQQEWKHRMATLWTPSRKSCKNNTVLWCNECRHHVNRNWGQLGVANPGWPHFAWTPVKAVLQCFYTNSMGVGGGIHKVWSTMVLLERSWIIFQTTSGIVCDTGGNLNSQLQFQHRFACQEVTNWMMKKWQRIEVNENSVNALGAMVRHSPLLAMKSVTGCIHSVHVTVIFIVTIVWPPPVNFKPFTQTHIWTQCTLHWEPLHKYSLVPSPYFHSNIRSRRNRAL